MVHSHSHARIHFVDLYAPFSMSESLAKTSTCCHTPNIPFERFDAIVNGLLLFFSFFYIPISICLHGSKKRKGELNNSTNWECQSDLKMWWRKKQINKVDVCTQNVTLPSFEKKRKNHQVTSTDRWVRRRVKNVSFYPFFRHEFCIIICRTRPSFLFLTGKWAK